MKIAGLQKTTLIDYPSVVACTIFLHSCNFRCGFCYNPDLVIHESKSNLSEEEILNFLKKRQGKLEGVCITGGEPLISLEKTFLKKIKEMGYLIKIDTNGSFPEKLKEIIDEKLVDYVAMDIKSTKEKYPQVVGINVDLKKIGESIKLIYDFGNYEFRTTIIKKFHDAKEMERIGKWLSEICGTKPKQYFLQGFKNKNNFIDENFKNEKDVTESYMKELKKIADNYFEKVEIRV